VISSYLKVRLGLTAAFAVVLFCLVAAQAAVLPSGPEYFAGRERDVHLLNGTFGCLLRPAVRPSFAPLRFPD
jgi:hypothetical protein